MVVIVVVIVVVVIAVVVVVDATLKFLFQQSHFSADVTRRSLSDDWLGLAGLSGLLLDVLLDLLGGLGLLDQSNK